MNEAQEPEDTASKGEGRDGSRREFLKIAATVSGVIALGAIASVAKSVIIPAVPGQSETTTLGFPRVKVATVGSLTLNKVVTFNYPLENEPNVLVKLGEKATGGVGPDGDIVAFSQICQHLGCIWGYVPPGGSPVVNKSFVAQGPVGYCPCHGSIYDLTEAGKVIGGPAPRPEPQVTLEVDSSGNIYATRMGPPTIFGHNTGSTDVSYDLQGGTEVPSS